jgi:transcriptional regulator with XRE-family HTH domain
MPAKLWKPNPSKLRELRETRGLSQRRLAELADVDAETIADIELGRRRGVRTRTLEKLGDALSTTWEKLLSDRERARRIRSAQRLAHDLVPESHLDLLSLADAEQDPKLETRFGLLEAFGPAEMVDTIAAPRVREGDRYYAFGEVCRQRPVSTADEVMLGLPALECARFELLRRPDPDLQPYAVTVFTRTREQTRTLQQEWRNGALVHVVVRVLVARLAPDDAEQILVTNLVSGAPLSRPRTVDGKPWTGFDMIASQTRFMEKDMGRKWLPQPWALVVEELAEGRTVQVPSPALAHDRDDDLMADLEDLREDVGSDDQDDDGDG